MPEAALLSQKLGIAYLERAFSHIVLLGTIRLKTKKKMAEEVPAAPATSSASAPAAPEKQTPADFLRNVLGRPVSVKLNSGVEYRGKFMMRIIDDSITQGAKRMIINWTAVGT